MTIIYALLVVIFINGLLSLTEAAFFTIPLYRVRLLAEKKWRAKILLGLKTKSELPLVAIISLSNITTIVGSMFIGAMVTSRFGSEWLGVFSGIATFLIMVFSEIVPKKIGERFNQVISLNTAIFLKLVSFLFYPLAWLVHKMVSPFTAKTKLPLTSEEEIAFLAKIGGREGSIEEDESAMIEKVFALNDLPVTKLINSFSEIVKLDGRISLLDAKEKIMSATSTHLPIYTGQEDNITGMAYRPHLLSALLRGEGRRPTKEYGHLPITVSIDQKADKVLELMQKYKTYAVLVYEHGQLRGVIELENLLRQLIETPTPNKK